MQIAENFNDWLYSTFIQLQVRCCFDQVPRIEKDPQISWAYLERLAIEKACLGLPNKQCLWDLIDKSSS